MAKKESDTKRGTSNTISQDRLKEYEEILKEYEETLNKIFGTHIKWSKLSLKELEELSEALTKREVLEKLCKRYSVSGEVETIIDSIVPPKEQGPILKALKRGLKILRKLSEAQEQSK